MEEPNKGQEVVQEEQPVVAVPTTEKPAEVIDETEGMSERTKEQFLKLKAHNEELASKLAAKEEENAAPNQSVLDELHPAYVPTAQPAKDEPYVIDEDGTVDVEQLNKVLKNAQETARLAREEAALARSQVQQSTKERAESAVHAKYPQLVRGNPNFDPDFFRRVKNELIGQMMEGKEDYMAAADSIAKLFNTKSVEEKVEEKVEEFKKTTEAKQNINAGTGAANNRTYSDNDELAKRTRQGDLSAFSERLKRAGL